MQRKFRSLSWLLLIFAAFWQDPSYLPAAGSPPVEAPQVEVDGFKATYSDISTPKEKWNDAQEEKWILGTEGTFVSKKTLRYRKSTLPPGKHDFWVEKGKGEWLYLVIGDKDESDAPRLRAMFRLYEKESGVERLSLGLKLTRRGQKLKFSFLAGRSEGHGNLNVGD